jgi:DNA-binding Lrp family transcriptional regulator
MPKRSKENIEIDTQQIIKVFQENARISLNELAEKTGFSRQKIWRIIKNLEKNKTIWGYTTIIDEKKQKLNNYILLVKKNTLPMDEKTLDMIVSRDLDKLAEKIGVTVETSKYVHGEYDWILSITAEDIKQVKMFSEIFYKLYKNHVTKLHILETLFTAKKHKILNPENKKLKDFV